ncbi:hypothetical protein [Burkholderia glumae]|uniref:hypothetical protein n=1 Tax=Burkholderia glumae TaxID=337 RepID=UPI0012D31FA9|nr:hypothetical protein B7759_05860 [Burkholderia glumae]
MNLVVTYVNQWYERKVPYPVLGIFLYLRQSLYESVDESTAAYLLWAYRRGFNEIRRCSESRTGGLLQIEHPFTGGGEPDVAVKQQAERLGRLHGRWARLYREALV